LLHGGEKQFFFFPVMALVHEYREKLKQMIHVQGIIRCPGLLDPLSDTLQDPEGQANGIMLHS
jgi:hypothetical protein